MNLSIPPSQMVINKDNIDCRNVNIRIKLFKIIDSSKLWLLKTLSKNLVVILIIGVNILINSDG